MASGPQKPEILMSHSWGGYFRDFMAVVDKDAGRVSFVKGELD